MTGFGIDHLCQTIDPWATLLITRSGYSLCASPFLLSSFGSKQLSAKRGSCAPGTHWMPGEQTEESCAQVRIDDSKVGDIGRLGVRWRRTSVRLDLRATARSAILYLHRGASWGGAADITYPATVQRRRNARFGYQRCLRKCRSLNKWTQGRTLLPATAN